MQDITIETAEAVLTKLINATNEGLRSGEVVLTTQLLESVVSLNSSSAKITDGIVTIIDNVLDRQGEYGESGVKNGSGTRMLQIMEKQLEIVDLTITNGSFEIIKPNIAVQVQRTTKADLESGITFLSTGSNIEVLKYEIRGHTQRHGNGTHLDAAISVQSYSHYLVNDNGLSNNETSPTNDMRVAVSIVRLQTAPVVNGHDDGRIHDGMFQNTPLVSVTVFGSHLYTNVTTMFKPLKKTNDSVVIDDPVCVYWDYEEDNGRGAWSSFGCMVVEAPSIDSMLMCKCNHTTNFAILMRSHDIIRDSSQDFTDASKMLSLVGCALSMACLTITLAVYGFSLKLRVKQPNQIFMCICISLLLLYVTFVINVVLEENWGDSGETKHEEKRLTGGTWCSVLAGLVQYFTLTTLSWMAVEGFNMYLLFVRVVKPRVPSFMVKASLFSWGVPLLIVIATGSISGKADMPRETCFLTKLPLIIGLLIPIGIILLSNGIIYMTLMVRLCGKLYKRKSRREKRSSEISQRLHKSLCIFMLLGLTWSFGYLLWVDHDSNMVFQILFIVLNSFQGFLIFVLYCLRQPLVRQEMARCCFCSFQPTQILSYRYSVRGTAEKEAASDCKEGPTAATYWRSEDNEETMETPRQQLTM